MDSLSIPATTTALILIDLQQGIVVRQTAPHSATAVIENAVKLADRFRALASPVVLVRVNFSPDGKDILTNPVDSPSPFRPGQMPPDWSNYVPQLGPQVGDILITKHQWGAFYGTELDLQLRRRKITTIVLGGIATNFGVESTARDAWERNYSLIFAEDATSAISAEAHAFAITTIFPRLGRIRSTAEILNALS